MKKIKFNLLAIIGIMVAVGTLAFTAPKSMADLAWFYTEADGEIIKDQSYTQPPLECNGDEHTCAVAFMEDDLVNGKPTIDYVDEAPAGLIQDQRKRD